MEPFSFAAATVGVFAHSCEAGVGFRDYVRRIRNFPEDIRDVCRDLEIEETLLIERCGGLGLSRLNTSNAFSHALASDNNWVKPFDGILAAFKDTRKILQRYEETTDQTQSQDMTTQAAKLAVDYAKELHAEGSLRYSNQDKLEKLSELVRSQDQVRDNLGLKDSVRGASDIRDLKQKLERIRGLNKQLRLLYKSSAHREAEARNRPSFNFNNCNTSLFNIPLSLPHGGTDIYGRDEIMSSIQEALDGELSKLNLGRKVAVLHGFSGVGKTSICSNYAHQHGEKYSATIWIQATDQATVDRTSFNCVERIIRCYLNRGLPLLQIASFLEFYDNPPADYQKLCNAVTKRGAAKVLKDWLSKESNEHWLLVVDDLDRSLRLSDLLPNEPVGRVLVTTQNSDIEFEEGGKRICVPTKINPDDGVELLLKLAKPEISRDSAGEELKKQARELVETLHCFPFVLRTAGSFIRSQRGGFGAIASKLRDDLGHLYEGKLAGPKHTLNKLWEVSLLKLNAEEQYLLSLIAFLGNDFSRRMLDRGKDKIALSSGEAIDYNEPFGSLCSLSFLTQDSEDEDRFTVHPLLSSWIRSRMKDEDEMRCSRLVVDIITSGLSLENRGPEEWEYEQNIVRQLDICYDTMGKFCRKELGKDGWALGAVFSLVRVYAYHGDIHKVDFLCRQALLRASDSGESTQLSLLRDHFGTNLKLQGKYDEALKEYKRALDGLNEMSPDDPCVINVTLHMASAFAKGEKNREAISEYRKVEKQLEHASAKGGSVVALLRETRLGLAKAYKTQGHISEAEQCFGKVIEGGPPDHPMVLDARHYKALIMDERGQYKDALAQYELILRAQKKILGEIHYATLDTMHSIGDLYRRREEYAQALEYFDKSLEGFRQVFGCQEHLCVLSALKGKADTLELQGKYKEALECFEELYTHYDLIARKNNIDDSQWVLAIANDVGRVLGKLGKYRGAFDWCRRALEGFERLEKKKELSEHHILTLCTRLVLGTIYEGQEDYPKALEQYRRVLDQFTTHGDSSKIVGKKYTTMCCIASVLSKQGDHEGALEKYQEAEKGQEKALGSKHPSTLEAVLGKAGALFDLERYDEALKSCKRVTESLSPLATRTANSNDVGTAPGATAPKNEHPVLLGTFYVLGRIQMAKNDYTGALYYLQRAIQGWKTTPPKDRFLVLRARYCIGTIHHKQKKHSVAHEHFKTILSSLSPDQSELDRASSRQKELWYRTLYSQAVIEIVLGEPSTAFDLLSDNLPGLGKALGFNDPTTLAAYYTKAKALEGAHNYAGALENYRVVSSRRKELPRKHADISSCRRDIFRVALKKFWQRCIP